MSYKELSKRLPAELVREVLSYVHDYSPDQSAMREYQMTAIQFYIEWSVPLLRKKYRNWQQYTLANPFHVCFHLTFNQQEFDAQLLG